MLACLELKLSQNYASCLSLIRQFRSQSGPFKPYMFANDLLHSVSSHTWWESQKDCLDNSMLTLCHQVLGAVSSRAGVEHILLYIWYSTLQTEEQTGSRQGRKTCVHIQTVKLMLMNRLYICLDYK